MALSNSNSIVREDNDSGRGTRRKDNGGVNIGNSGVTRL